MSGAPKYHQRHEQQGKMFVRQRIDRLLDSGSPFLELSPLAAYEVYGSPTAQELGGAEVHTRTSGVAVSYALDDEHALEIVRDIVAGLNQGKKVEMDVVPPEEPLYPADSLYGVIPPTFKLAYDVD